MKKVLSVLTVLVVVSMLFACANGGSGDSDKAPVKVSFNVETEHQSIARIVTVDSPTTTFDYYYAAIPQWTGDDFETIQGATGGTDANPTFVQINNYAAGANIGLFAQGSWKFYAQVKKGDTVVYQSSATPDVTYINASSHSVTLNVTKTTSGTANVTINVETPNTSGSPKLKVKYNGGSETTISASASTKTGWSKFSHTFTGLAAGSYLFELTSNDGTHNVGGASLAFDVIGGVNREIKGTIENGLWQTTLITINVPTIGVTIEADGNATTVAKGNSLTYTCTPNITNSTGTVHYQWYAGAASMAAVGTDSATYAFNAAAHASAGYYSVMCKVYIDNELTGSATLPVTVTD